MLILSLLTPFMIFTWFVSIEKQRIKKDVKEKIVSGLDKNELSLIALSVKEAEYKLRWEHSREFEYNGTMYDIVEKKESADSLFFWCWEDHEETSLNRKLSSMVNREIGSDKSLQSRYLAFSGFFSSLFSPVEKPKVDLNLSGEENYFSCYKINYLSLRKAPEPPPPKYIS